MKLDDRGAAAEMTRLLLRLGHWRIGFIMGDPLWGSSRARHAGYLEAMAEAGVEVAPDWVRIGAYTFQSGEQAARALLALPDRPTAIFASSDDMALGCLAAADEAGLSVPGDVSVAGFDDSTGSRFSRPSLTTLRQPLVEMAAAAAKALISGQVPPDCDSDAVTDQIEAFQLIERQSTAGPAKVGRRSVRQS
jgi:LacI family transcriptional regulator